MQPGAVNPRRDHHKPQRGGGGQTVAHRSHQAPPIGPVLIGGAGRVAGAKVVGGHPRRAVNPQRKHCEPAEELHNGELAHRARHGEQIADHLHEPAVIAALLPQAAGDQLHRAKPGEQRGEHVEVLGHFDCAKERRAIVAACDSDRDRDHDACNDPRRPAAHELRRAALGSGGGDTDRPRSGRFEPGDLFGRIFLG